MPARCCIAGSLDKVSKDSLGTCEGQAAGWAAGGLECLSSGPEDSSITMASSLKFIQDLKPIASLSPQKCGNWCSEEPRNQFTLLHADHCPAGQLLAHLPASRMAVPLPPLPIPRELHPWLPPSTPPSPAVPEHSALGTSTPTQAMPLASDPRPHGHTWRRDRVRPAHHRSPAILSSTLRCRQAP